MPPPTRVVYLRTSAVTSAKVSCSWMFRGSIARGEDFAQAIDMALNGLVNSNNRSEKSGRD
jgi:hypothetical protein